VPLEDSSAAAAIQEHAPFTAVCLSQELEAGAPQGGEGEKRQLVVGCQDGSVLIFSLAKGTVSGPLQELRVEATDQAQGDRSSLALSVTALLLGGTEKLYAGSCGRCHCWDLSTGALLREFVLPGPDGDERPATPGALAVVRASSGAEDNDMHLWVGLDYGYVAVFDSQSGVLVRSFSCAGPESVVSLAYLGLEGVVFALSAHRRVSVWEATTYGSLQKYPADLMTCGADLCSMVVARLRELELSLLLLAGVDGSYGESAAGLTGS